MKPNHVYMSYISATVSSEESRGRLSWPRVFCSHFSLLKTQPPYLASTQLLASPLVKGMQLALSIFVSFCIKVLLVSYFI